MVYNTKFIRLLLTSFIVVLLAGCTSQTDKSIQDKTSSKPQKDTSQSEMYIAMGLGNSIGVVDLATNKLIDMLPAGNNPHGIAVTPDGKFAFTTSTKMGKKEMIMEPDHGGEMDMAQMMKLGSDEIIVTDILKKDIIQRINVGGGSHHMDITPDGAYVLATVPSRLGVVFIDTKLFEETQFIETGMVPNYVEIAPNGEKAYVTNKGDDTVSILDLKSNKLITTVSTGIRPDHIAISPDSKFIYITNGGSDSVSVLDSALQEVIATIPVEEAPHGIAITPNGKRLYVSNSESKTVSVISTEERKVIKTISIENEVEHVSISPDGKFVYINSEGSGIIYVISTDSNEVVQSISVSKEPHQTAF